MSNRGFFSRGGSLNPDAALAGLPALVTLALGLCGCSSNSLQLPNMPWAKAKPIATRPSPYAPVPIGPPAPPAPPEDTTQYGDSIDRVVASVDGNPITNFDIQNPGAATAKSPPGNNSSAAMDPDTTLKQLIAQQLL